MKQAIFRHSGKGALYGHNEGTKNTEGAKMPDVRGRPREVEPRQHLQHLQGQVQKIIVNNIYLQIANSTEKFIYY